MRRRVSKLYSRSMKRVIDAATSSCSSVRSKFTSEPQGVLGDDVALDLVRSRVDRRLAHVAIARRKTREERIIEPSAVARRDRLGAGARGLEHELRQPLLDLGAADLEHRDLRPGCTTAAQCVDEAQVRDRQRRELDLQTRKLVAKAHVVDER